MNRSGWCIAVVFLGTLCAGAQTNITWQTADGGGGLSTGGIYSLDGTIGQPDGNDAVQGGVYEVQGGFWALIQLVQTAGAPALRMVGISSASVTLAWPVAGAEGFQLQRSSSLVDSGWIGVPGTPVVVGAEYHLTTEPVVVKHYYRLHKP